MKPFDLIRQYFLAVIFFLGVLAISFDTSAQNGRSDDRDGNWKEYTKKERSEKNKDRKDLRNERDEKTVRNEWRDRNSRYDAGRDWARDDNNEYHWHSKQMNHPGNDYYYHHKYGRVYNRLDHDALVFRHPRGNYFYSNNHFYVFRDGIGYCVVNPPRNVYFNELPFNCNKIRLNGQIYFRNGDLFFQLTHRGYVIVPSPLQINFMVRF